MSNRENTANHPAEGWILCRDPRLARLLETELAYMGVLATVYATLPPPSERARLVVADGDAFETEACVTLAAAFQEPLAKYRPRCAAAKACRRIANRIQGLPEPIKIR